MASRQEMEGVISPRGLAAGAASLFSSMEQECNLTDRLGVSGVCMIFPEYYQQRDKIQGVIRLGHQVDRIADGNYYRFERGLVSESEVDKPKVYGSLREFNERLSLFIGEHEKPIVQNVLTFLSQAATVEAYASDRFEMDEEEVVKYRELINAIWVRMVVSYGEGLLGNPQDELGECQYGQCSFEELLDFHQPYIQGEELDKVPEGRRSSALFLWTMEIQRLFDHKNGDYNDQHSLHAFRPEDQVNGSTYRERAAKVGVNPRIFDVSLVVIFALNGATRRLGREV